MFYWTQQDDSTATKFYSSLWYYRAKKCLNWLMGIIIAHAENLPGVSVGISGHDVIMSDPLEVVRSSIFSVFDKKIIQFLFTRVQHFTSRSPRESKVFIKAWFSCNIFSRITVCDSANSYEHSQHGMLLGLVEFIAISSFIWTIHNTYIQYIQEDQNLVWNNPQF